MQRSVYERDMNVNESLPALFCAQSQQGETVFKMRSE